MHPRCHMFPLVKAMGNMQTDGPPTRRRHVGQGFTVRNKVESTAGAVAVGRESRCFRRLSPCRRCLSWLRFSRRVLGANLLPKPAGEGESAWGESCLDPLRCAAHAVNEIDVGACMETRGALRDNGLRPREAPRREAPRDSNAGSLAKAVGAPETWPISRSCLVPDTW